MALVRADAMFKLYPAKAVHKQKVKLRPNEHHYENEGEEPYIKYSCQICEQLAKSVEGINEKISFGETSGSMVGYAVNGLVRDTHNIKENKYGYRDFSSLLKVLGVK